MTPEERAGRGDDRGDGWRSLSNRSAGVPHAPLEEETRRRLGLPRTLRPAPEGLEQPVVFDPAMKHFTRAYRAGEPRFADEATARAWRRARRTVLDLVLAGVAEGRWAGHLVLRGSVLMATWFPRAARDPGDLDFVVTPADWDIDDARTAELLADLVTDAANAADAAGEAASESASAPAASAPVRIDAAAAVTEDIWTYDRAPGRRILLPWTLTEQRGNTTVPGGTVQLDLVFNETLPGPPEPTRLRPLGDAPGARVLAATPGQSLAWKLLWLVTDAYPEAKDLYDAVLLAEAAPPTYEEVRGAFVLAGAEEALRPPEARWLADLEIEQEDWDAFLGEYPWVEGTLADHRARFLRALAPLLAELEQRPGETPYERLARWLEPLVDAARAAGPATAHPRPGSPLQRLAREGGIGSLAASVVIVREVLGREAVTPDEALRAIVCGNDAWRAWRDRPEWRERVLAHLPAERA